MKLNRRTVLSWALYDWANSAFALVVLSSFFPIFYKNVLRDGIDVAHSSFELGMANSIASIVVAALAPILGAVSDKSSARKRFLSAFATLGVLSTACLVISTQGLWVVALALFVLGNIGFAAGNIFYDSLLISVAPEEKSDQISALGFSLGYIGSALLFVALLVLVEHPELAGLADAKMATRISFIVVAAWWAVFTIPLLLWVPEPKADKSLPILKSAGEGLIQVFRTIFALRTHRNAATFLLAYWLYIDGVDTIIRMAADYGLSLGFDGSVLLKALLVTQFVAFPAALAFGWLGGKIGTKRALFIGIGVYALVTIWGFRMKEQWEFYVLAITVGLVQGGVQALSRSFYSRLIPRHLAGEFFGFYNMLGKAAAVIGPALMGFVGLLTGSTRFGILAIILLFIGGAFLLTRVEDKPADSPETA
ncbi:MFS transporter [bacterium]|nr:MFS transporter [bacterium]